MNRRQYQTAKATVILRIDVDVLTVSGSTPIDLWGAKTQTIGWHEPVIE